MGPIDLETNKLQDYKIILKDLFIFKIKSLYKLLDVCNISFQIYFL